MWTSTRSSFQEWPQAQKAGEAIPFGQAILVGYQSERKHRRDLSTYREKCETLKRDKGGWAFDL